MRVWNKLILCSLLSVLGFAPVGANAPVKLHPSFFNNDGVPDHPTDFKWLLVENNVGNYDGDLGEENHPCNADTVGFPFNCEWPSIRAIKATAPIYSSGDNTEWNSITPFGLPEGKYMVTVMAEGYRLCGGYFTVSAADADQSIAKDVYMSCQKHPLPLGTVRVFVFEDNAPCNGQYDGPAEKPLKGFGIGINDMEGPITEDYYGNSLLEVESQDDGMIVVPNMWPMRYDIDVVPPPGEGWIKTNTLEGGHGWDYWLYEAWDGYDNEFIVGAEKFPFAVAAFIQETNNLPNPPTATTWNVIGRIETVSVWYPFIAGAALNENGNGNIPGIRKKGPLFNQDGIVAITDLNNLDTVNYVGRADPDGNFTIPNVPEGSYQISWFDITQRFILQTKTFTVPGQNQGDTVDLKSLFLTGWYTEIHGFFFLDENENGIMDVGEQGISDGPFPVVRLRDGTQIDRGFQFEVPFNDPNRLGYYNIAQVYPLTSWFTMNFFHPEYSTTGYSYQMEFDEFMHNVSQSDPTKELFDISLFGVPGVTTRLDIGFRLKKDRTPNTGSIYGSVNYDTTRVNLDAEAAVTENHEPGLPNINVKLTRLDGGSKACGTCRLQHPDGWNCGPLENITRGQLKCERFWVQNSTYDMGMRPQAELLFTAANDFQGAKRGQVLPENGQGNIRKEWNTTTEEFDPPVNCRIKDDKGNTISYPDDQQVLPNPSDPGVPCIETPLLGNQVGGWTPVAGMFHFDNLEPGLYAIQVEIPLDKVGKPAYKIRSEESVNTYDSDIWQCVPEGTGCPLCPSTHENCPMPVDPVTPQAPYCQNIPMPCAGELFTVGDGDNPSFAKNGGSHDKGREVHSCDIKIVRVEAGRTARPTFHLFTDVPIPSRWKGLVLDDVQLQWNPRAVTYSELLGVPHMPIGIYDYKGTKLTDIETDGNGYFEVLVPPSRNNANAPSASAIMSAVWCMRGNDAGTPGFPSSTPPKPNYRSITACFEALPGRIIPVDLAPVTISSPVALPDGDIIQAPCDLPQTKPELFNVFPEPICTGFPCILRIRGRNFGTAPTVNLAVPTEQDEGPYGTGGTAFTRQDVPLVTRSDVQSKTGFDEVSEATEAMWMIPLRPFVFSRKYVAHSILTGHLCS